MLNQNSEELKNENFNDKSQQNSKNYDSILNENEIRYKEALNYAKNRLEKWIHLFVKKGTIKVMSFGIRGIFSGIQSLIKNAFDDLGGEGNIPDLLDSKSANLKISEAEIDKFEDNTVDSVRN